MPAKQVLTWIKYGWTKFVDPDREKRISDYVRTVHGELARRRSDFDYTLIASKLDMDDDEREIVSREVLKKCVARAWSDNSLTEKEQRSLETISTLLGIPATEYVALVRQAGLDVFIRVATHAFRDGILSDEEFEQLQGIAESCGSTFADMFRQECAGQGEAIVRNLFVTALDDGQIEPCEWEQITKTFQRLGMSDGEFRQAIKSPAQQVVEHFLADAKDDGLISKKELDGIDWLLDNLIADQNFTRYVRNEITETNRLAAIRSGKLPSIEAPPGVSIRSGEIVHFAGRCTHSVERLRRGENTVCVTDGTGIVTDDRFVFISTENSNQIIHRQILGYRRLDRGIEIQLSKKAACGKYEFQSDWTAATEIWITSIGRANQTIVSSTDDQQTRHIPRDVRQRTWQRFGGRCAECSATDYLEFDHIIPFSKGGSNSDNNVQLLCRRCNLKKSDRI